MWIRECRFVNKVLRICIREPLFSYCENKDSGRNPDFYGVGRWPSWCFTIHSSCHASLIWPVTDMVTMARTKLFFSMIMLMFGRRHVFCGNAGEGECIQSWCLGLLVPVCGGNITFLSFDLRHNQVLLKLLLLQGLIFCFEESRTINKNKLHCTTTS